MPSPTVLVISYMLPPLLYPQSIQIGRLLGHLDARVIAVSGADEGEPKDPNLYPDFDAGLTARLKVPPRLILPGMLHRLGVKFFSPYGGMPDHYRWWKSKAEKAVDDYLRLSGASLQALLTFGEPMSDHLVGQRLKARLGLPWIAHFSDPWVDSPFRRPLSIVRKVNQNLERQVIELADRVVFTSLETVELVMKKYPAEWRRKARVVPHSFDPSQYPDKASAGRKDGSVIRYIGNFYGDRSPQPLFAGLQALVDMGEDIRDVRFEIIGHVPARMLFSKAYRSLPPGLLTIRPPVSYMQSLAEMINADALLVIDAAADLSVFLPSKLIDYLGACRPVAGITPPGASASLISALGGLTANPRNTEEVATMIKKLVKDVKNRDAKDQWGNDSIRSQYTIDRVGLKFGEIIAETLA